VLDKRRGRALGCGVGAGFCGGVVVCVVGCWEQFAVSNRRHVAKGVKSKHTAAISPPVDCKLSDAFDARVEAGLVQLILTVAGTRSRR
jgi:hypothetical protein